MLGCSGVWELVQTAALTRFCNSVHRFWGPTCFGAGEIQQLHHGLQTGGHRIPLFAPLLALLFAPHFFVVQAIRDCLYTARGGVLHCEPSSCRSLEFLQEPAPLREDAEVVALPQPPRPKSTLGQAMGRLASTRALFLDALDEREGPFAEATEGLL